METWLVSGKEPEDSHTEEEDFDEDEDDDALTHDKTAHDSDDDLSKDKKIMKKQEELALNKADIDEDFDPEKHDGKMQGMLNNYDDTVAQEEKKLSFSDLEDEDNEDYYIEDHENWTGAAEEKIVLSKAFNNIPNEEHSEYGVIQVDDPEYMTNEERNEAEEKVNEAPVKSDVSSPVVHQTL